jgi:hypothetical protein
LFHTGSNSSGGSDTWSFEEAFDAVGLERKDVGARPTVRQMALKRSLSSGVMFNDLESKRKMQPATGHDLLLYLPALFFMLVVAASLSTGQSGCPSMFASTFIVCVFVVGEGRVHIRQFAGVTKH